MKTEHDHDCGIYEPSGRGCDCGVRRQRNEKAAGESKDAEIARLKADLVRAIDALTTIRDTEGKVCPNYETCKHVVCRSSHAAWEIASAALVAEYDGREK